MYRITALFIVWDNDMGGLTKEIAQHAKTLRDNLMKRILRISHSFFPTDIHTCCDNSARFSTVKVSKTGLGRIRRKRLTLKVFLRERFSQILFLHISLRKP